jgi:predicted AAA+ superfamily ATPase
MIKREFWIHRIETAWKKRSVIWLAGVRRVGKTFLCQSLEDVEYFDCDAPRDRERMKDPQDFLDKVKGKRIVLDEIHQLDRPSELLKLAADYYPTTSVIATGSSTLEASRKFRDTLTGRKVKIHLPPLLYEELPLFDGKHLSHRLLYGGLPPFFLSARLPVKEFKEWLSAYWSKDIQELFKLERYNSFLKFVELILAQSGTMFEASRFAPLCEVSRPTISNYLSILEATYLVSIIRPFSHRSSSEIISAPRVYGFDTGFVCYCRGWQELRPEDLGQLWEHLVLNEMLGQVQEMPINYWRDKQGHEIDFVLLKNRKEGVISIECKWSAAKFDPRNLKIFRSRYPLGKNYLVAADVDRDYERNYEGIKVHFVSLPTLISSLLI